MAARIARTLQCCAGKNDPQHETELWILPVANGRKSQKTDACLVGGTLVENKSEWSRLPNSWATSRSKSAARNLVLASGSSDEANHVMKEETGVYPVNQILFANTAGSPIPKEPGVDNPHRRNTRGGRTSLAGLTASAEDSVCEDT